MQSFDWHRKNSDSIHFNLDKSDQNEILVETKENHKGVNLRNKTIATSVVREGNFNIVCRERVLSARSRSN